MKKIIQSIILIVMSVNIYSQTTLYFTGAVNNNWNTVGNWSTNSGGSSSGTIPNTTTYAVFDNNSPKCKIEANLTTKRISLESGFTDSIIVKDSIIVTLTDTLFQKGGTFNSKSSTLNLQKGILQTAGNFIASSLNTTFGGCIKLDGNFYHNNGKILFNITTNIYSNFSVYNFDFGGANSFTVNILQDKILTVENDMKFISPTTTGLKTLNGPGKIYLKKNLYQATSNGSMDIQGNITIVMNGSENQNIYGNNLEVATLCNLPKIEINKTSGTLFLNGIISSYGGFDLVNGNFDASTNSSTVQLIGSQTNVYPISFYNLNIVSYSTTTSLNVNTGADITVLNDLKLLLQNTQNSRAINGPGKIKIEGDIYQAIPNGSSNFTGNIVFSMTGQSEQHIYGNNDLTSTTASLNKIEINKYSGIVYLHDAMTSSGGFDLISGLVDSKTYNSTVQLVNSMIFTNDFEFNHLIFYPRTGSAISISINQGKKLSVLGNLTYNALSTSTVSYTTVNGPGTIDLYGNLTTVQNGIAVNAGGGNALIKLVGNNDQSIIGNTTEGLGRLPSILVDKPNGLILLEKKISISFNFEVNENKGISKENTYVILFGAVSLLSTGNNLEVTGIKLKNNNIKLNGTLIVKEGINLNTSNLDLNGNILRINNSSPLALNYTTGSLYAEAENFASKVIWRFSNQVSTKYIIPFKANRINIASIPIEYTIDSIGDDDDDTLNNYIEFSSYSTNYSVSPNNLPYPTEIDSLVDSLGANNSLHVMDRYWKYDVRGLTKSPNIFIRLGINSWDDNPTNIITSTREKAQIFDGLNITPMIGNISQQSSNIIEFFTQRIDRGVILIGDDRYPSRVINIGNSSSSKLSCITNFNTIESKVYDEDGNEVGHTKSFFDGMARTHQAMSKNYNDNIIIASQTLYDDWGRTILTSMPAPIPTTDYEYYCPFMKTYSGVGFSIYKDYNTDYFNKPITVDNLPGEINNPKALIPSATLPIGIEYRTLADYYSNNNVSEPYISKTQYPFSTIEYLNDPSGAVKRTAGPGEQYKMGSGHEARSFRMPASGELFYVRGFKDRYLNLKYQGVGMNYMPTEFTNGNTLACSDPMQTQIAVYKTINVDAHGVESIIFNDIDGKVLATCLSGKENGVNVHEQLNYIDIPANEFRDIHLADGCQSSIEIDFSNLGSAYMIGSYKITDINQNFKVIYTDNFDETPTLPAGYYRIQWKGPSDEGGFIRVKFKTNYYHFALNYYDAVGRLISTVPPLGVDYIDPLVYQERETLCKDVNTIERTISSTYEDDFGFTDFVDSDPNDSTENIFDIKLSTTCPTTAYPPTGGVYSTGLLLFNYINPLNYEIKNTFGNTNFAKPIKGNGDLKDIILRATGDNIKSFSKAPPQIPINQTTVYEGNQGNLNINAIYETGSATVYTFYLQPYVKFNDGTINDAYDIVKLPYIITHYSSGVTYPTATNTNGILQFFSKFWMTGSTPSYLPIKNENLLAKSTMNCGIKGFYFKVVACYKAELNIQRTDISSLGIPGYTYFDILRGNIEGVEIDPSAEANLAGIKFVYTRKTSLYKGNPQHKMATATQYNSTGETKWTYSPDGKRSDFKYRNDGTLRFSQDAQQRSSYKFSYTLYDHLDRPIESGVYDPALGGAGNAVDNINSGTALYFEPQLAPISSPITIGTSTRLVNDLLELADDIEDSRCTDVHKTTYDNPVALPTDLASFYTQKYLNGAVSQASTYDIGTGSMKYAIWYSYDEKGRVAWSINYNNGFGYTTMDYTYNTKNQLVKVEYNKNDAVDHFTHNYEYTPNGQLKKTTTTNEQGITIVQAQYQYSKNGSLLRTELGNKLQGIDYTYTLNGQLKAINHPSLNNYDPGQDGYTGAHSDFAKDVYGLILDYHADDYKGIYDARFKGFNTNLAPNQYNGSIKDIRWQTRTTTSTLCTFPIVDHPTVVSQQNMYAFKYNKIGWMTDAVFGGLLPGLETEMRLDGLHGGFNATNYYKENNLTYDLNGNIKTLQRTSGEATNLLIDNLTYNYTENTNKLNLVHDASTHTLTLDDIKDQPTGGLGLPDEYYTYNEIGELVRDYAKGYHIYYNALHKVKEVRTCAYLSIAGSEKLIVSYEYDASGNRAKKTNYNPTSTANEKLTETYYINDASGQNIRIYQRDIPTIIIAGDPKVYHVETPIYASGRIGIQYSTLSITTTFIAGGGISYTKTISNIATRYELTDHLGNVRATISDTKIAGEAELLSWADYYAMGWEMPGRHMESSLSYRYGYQGQFGEKSPEFGTNDFDYRNYDAKIGRWTTTDPHQQFYSPYVGMGSMWPNAIDPDGRDVILLNDRNGARGAGHAAMLVGSNLTGWYLISKEGTTQLMGIAGYPNEDTKNNIKNHPYFKTFDDFMISDYNKDHEFKGKTRYEKGIFYSTTYEKDKQILDLAYLQQKKEYNVLSENCLQACILPLMRYRIIPEDFRNGAAVFPNITIDRLIKQGNNNFYLDYLKYSFRLYYSNNSVNPNGFGRSASVRSTESLYLFNPRF